MAHFSDQKDGLSKESARRMGKYLAQQDLYKFHYRRIYEHNPEKLGPKFEKLYDKSVALYDREDPKAYAITINPGNYEDPDLFLSDIFLPIWQSLLKKKTIGDFHLYSEFSPTGRIHIHGTIFRRKSKRVIHCSEIRSQLKSSMPEIVKDSMYTQHIKVEPIYNSSWSEYESKAPIHYANNLDPPSEITQINFQKTKK